MENEAAEALSVATLRMVGMGMALERALYALMSAHPNWVGLNQALLAELNPTKAPHMHPEPVIVGWHSIAERLLEHSAMLAGLAQSGQATKN